MAELVGMGSPEGAEHGELGTFPFAPPVAVDVGEEIIDVVPVG